MYICERWLSNLCNTVVFEIVSGMEKKDCCCCSFAKLYPTLWPHELQHSRLPCPSLSPGFCSNSCPLSWWCHPTISSLPHSSPFAFILSQHQGLSHWVGSSHRVASFSISPSSEYSGLICSKIAWFDLLAVQGTLKSLLQHHNSKALRTTSYKTLPDVLSQVRISYCGPPSTLPVPPS